jgi:hypothetical protein
VTTTAPGAKAVNPQLVLHVIAPLVAFYGLRALGVPAFGALLAGAAVSAATALHSIATQRRVGGVQVFVLATMALTVLFALVSGDARLMLVRNGWGTAALGLWALLTLVGKRPFLLSTGAIAFPEDKAATWERNWTRHPAFRTLLRRCTAIWGTLFLLDAALRVGMALTLPIDLVPALDDILIAVTIAAILAIQRFYGRSFLRRHGLRLHGAEIVPTVPSDG